MSKIITVPDDLYDKAAELAARGHVTVEEFIAAVLADRLTHPDVIETRANLFDRDEFRRALDAIPDSEAEPYDRL